MRDIKKRYHDAYRMRNLIATIEYFRAERSYPIGFDCEDYGRCDDPCGCLILDLAEEEEAKRAANIIAGISPDMDWELFDKVGQHWIWKRNCLDPWGNLRDETKGRYLKAFNRKKAGVRSVWIEPRVNVISDGLKAFIQHERNLQ